MDLSRLYDQLALIAATLVQVWGGKKIKPDHFTPWLKEGQEQSVNEMKRVAQQIAAQQNAACERRQRRGRPGQPKIGK